MLNIKRKFSIALLLSVYFMISVNAQNFNKFDANGKRTGVWKKFYDNGKIRYSGVFKNGKEIGSFNIDLIAKNAKAWDSTKSPLIS